jgi:predicted permease
MEILTTIMPEFINPANRLVYYFAIPAMVFSPPRKCLEDHGQALAERLGCLVDFFMT